MKGIEKSSYKPLTAWKVAVVYGQNAQNFKTANKKNNVVWPTQYIKPLSMVYTGSSPHRTVVKSRQVEIYH